MAPQTLSTTRNYLRSLRWFPMCAGVASLLLMLASCTGLPSAGGATGSGGGVEDFSVVAYQGEDVLGAKEARFSQVFRQNKPVVLNFWAGQCPPCRAEMPAFQRVADDYQGRMQVIGLDVGDFTGLGTQDDARQLLQELHTTYPTAYALDANPLQVYNVRA